MSKYIEYVPGEKYALPRADISNYHTVFEDCGYLLEDSDLIVDIDNVNKDILEKIIEYFSINTQIVWTDRGVHLYFRKPSGFRGGKRVCALGIEVEYKTKRTNKSITIKRNGKLREIVNEGLRSELPKIFKLDRGFNNIYGLEGGDGRNNALISHRIALKEVEGFKEIIRFINDNIFAEPLPGEELDKTVLRDNFTMINAGSSEYDVADYLINTMNIRRIGNNVYYYNGLYHEQDEDNLKNLIYSHVGKVKTKFIDEVFKQIKYRSNTVNNKILPIKLKNGVLKEGKFIDVDYKDFTVYYINIEYDENIEPVQIVDDYINHLTDGDEDYKLLLLEILAHCLITDPEFKRALAKFFIFVGDGGNGKGTLLEIIRKILNVRNCSGLSIKQMSDERYFSSMIGKLANLGDDIEDEVINNRDMKILKNVSTCDFVELRKLFSNSKSDILTTSLIFTSNHILKSFEKGDSYKRRVMWLPMFNKPKVKDPKFITKITSKEALKYWVKLIVDAYIRLYEKGKFTNSDLVNNWNKDYHDNNDNTSIYLESFKVEDIEGKRPLEIYEEYRTWCEENDYTPSKKMLRQSIQNIFGLVDTVVKINGKSVRAYKNRTITKKN